MERGLLTPLKKLRRQVFVEMARIAFETDRDKIIDAVEGVPYKITPGDKPLYRESIWRERAICAERVRLSMGLSLRPEDRPVHVTAGLSGSDIMLDGTEQTQLPAEGLYMGAYAFSTPGKAAPA